MSGLDHKQKGGNKSLAITFNEGSAFLPVKRQKIETLCVTLKNNKLTPWRWFKSLGIEITDFYGKPISIRGVCYDGTPVLVFWRFIEPFLKDAIVRTLEETLEICRVKNYNAEPHLRETAMLLSGYLIGPIYWEMVDIDQHLSGNGNPRSVPRRDPRVEIADMERFLNKCRDEMIQGEANGKPDTKEQPGANDSPPVPGRLEIETKAKRYLIAAIGVSAVLIAGFEYSVYKLPWYWLRNHPNSYGIQAVIDGIILLFMLRLCRPKWRKFCWYAIGTLLICLPSLLGGPTSAGTSTQKTP
jgi:hypothetical protein